MHVPKQKRKKWDKKSKKMIFVGYDSTTKGYRCVNPDTGKILVSRDVIFHEDLRKEEMALKSQDKVCEIKNVSEGLAIDVVGNDNSDEGIVDNAEIQDPVVENGDQTLDLENNEDVIVILDDTVDQTNDQSTETDDTFRDDGETTDLNDPDCAGK